MIRKTGIFAGTLFLLTPFLMGQGTQNQSQPRFPEDTLAPVQLVAWTWMQKPQPMWQPLPLPNNAILPAGQDVNCQKEPQTAQIFVGKIKIVKDGDQLVFETANGNSLSPEEPKRGCEAIRRYGNEDQRYSR
jgi:hypothetical protein